ncbi:MAG: poly(3-hydroxybutyrate) depolymerase [Anaerolineae bacterium]|nr:poly(3-hydroxybutyrate) depolymerase [Anaerolineae bacterium]NUQ04449.1 poly(3-hydroxybutyrate) depolymerase [Anaerolineae bacterium]
MKRVNDRRRWGVVILGLLWAWGGLANPASALAQTASAACSSGAPEAPGWRDLSLVSGGEERHFRLYVPTGYDGTTPLPVVLSMHGFSSNPQQQRDFSRWDVYAEQETFLAVFPRGTGFPLRWNAGAFFHARSGAAGSAFMGAQVDDVAFFGDLLDDLAAALCIDTARIYATGLSNGGGMSHRLACEMADRITAIGTVAGAYPALDGGCTPARPVPVISFHGVVDPIVPYEGSEAMRLPNIETWAREWSERDGCADAAITQMALPSGSAASAPTITQYGSCAGGAEVALYTIPDGGHTWPGAAPSFDLLIGRTRQDFDATAIMWAFFQRFALDS